MGRFIAISLVLLGACGGKATGGSSTTSGSGSQCSWPASLNSPADAGSQAVSAGRFLMVCQYDVDGGEHGPFHGSAICVTDATMCPVDSVGTNVQCVDWCKADEYAVKANGVQKQTPDGGPPTLVPPSTLPASCRPYGLGLPYWCCPCG